MADPFAIAGLAISGAGLVGNIINQLNAPDFPLTEDDLNKIFDLRLERGLSNIASGARRRLIGAGQEGSGAIESVIGDLQTRFREQIEEQRRQGLNDLRLATFQADTQASERLSGILGGATGLGFNMFGLSETGQQFLSPFGGDQGNFNQVSPGENMEFNKFQINPFDFNTNLPGQFNQGTGSFGAQSGLGIR